MRRRQRAVREEARQDREGEASAKETEKGGRLMMKLAFSF
jgi:hypothetical protein